MMSFKNCYPLLFLLNCLILLGCLSSDKNKSNHFQDSQVEYRKQRGVHVFGHIDSSSFQPILKNNFEWITYVPWGDQKNYDSPKIAGGPPLDSLNLIRKDSIWKTQITLAHEAGLKVFLKPHVWIYRATDGKWRSDIFPTNDKNWESWKTSYRSFILYYAQIAEKYNVEMFCIGTEFTRLTIEKPEFWIQLIQDIRKIYSGKLTYAANWYEEFEKITFWSQLDYIGIQAYFPLVKNKNPTVQQISKGWKKHLSVIKRVHKKFNKKILFTEIGYKSMEDSAIEPWQWIDYEANLSEIPVSTNTQMNCYQAFFDTFWGENWFAGVHIWQWRAEHHNTGGKNNLDFTPQNKPAENIIAKEFGKK